MTSYRIDIKPKTGKLPFIYILLKWVILVYITGASIFLLDKIYFLLARHINTFYQWLAVILNLLLVVVLARQLLRLNEVRYLIVTEEQIKYRQHFPWASSLSWSRIKQIQFGYSSVRFVTKGGKKYRFSLSKATQEEQSKLYEALDSVAKKYDVEFLRPLHAGG